LLLDTQLLTRELTPPKEKNDPCHYSPYRSVSGEPDNRL
jgi:hypothetical protein